MNNLKEYRGKRGFTQVQVADKVKMTVRAYQRYEAGERDPKLKLAKRFAKILGTTVEKLFPDTAE